MVKKKHVELAKVATIHTGSRISLFWKKKKKKKMSQELVIPNTN